MAVPVVQGTQTSTTNTAGTSHTVTLPASVAAGEMVLVTVAFSGVTTYTLPSGWSQVNTGPNTWTSVSAVLQRATGGESSMTITTASSVRMAARAFRISGAHQTIAPAFSTNSNVTNANPNPPSYTDPNGSDDHLWLAIYSAAASVTTSAYPTSYVTTNTVSATSGPTLGTATRTATASTTEDPATFTISASNAWRANTVAIRAAVPPVAGYTYTQTYNTRTLVFTDTSTFYPSSWAWTFGDTTTSSSQNPSKTYSANGTYTVALTATNAAGSSSPYSQAISVTIPSPAFTYVQTAGTLTVAFTNTSTAATSYSWAFGDGTTSTSTSPSRTYAAAGRYTVSLTATSATGTSTSTATITVIPVPETPPARPDGLDVALELYANGSWYEFTCDVTQASWNWGASANQGMLTTQEAGQLTFTAWDPDREWDPRNLVSRWYGVLDIGTTMRVKIGSTVVFSGRITGIVHGLDRAHGVDFVTVSAEDTLATLGRFAADADGVGSYAAANTDVRIGALADAAGWPAGGRDIASSPTPQALQALTASDQVWPLMVAAAQSDGGRVQVTQQGTLHFRERTTAWATSAATLTLGCDGNVDVESLDLAATASAIVNSLEVGRVGGSTSVVSDAASIATYGKWTATKTDLQLSTVGSETTWGAFVLARQKAPMYGVSGSRFALTSAIAATVTTAKMGDRWRVRDEHHGPMIDLTQRLLGLTYMVGPTRVLVTAALGEDYGLTSSLTEYRATWAAEAEWEVASAYGLLNVNGDSGSLAVTDKVV